MKDPNEAVYTRKTLMAAMATNCSYYEGMEVRDRYRRETPILLDALAPYIKDSGRIVDFGVGVGRVANALLDKYPGITVIGVDNSANMLEHAREFISRRHFLEGRIELLSLSDFESIESESVDLTILVYTLQHVSQPIIQKVLSDFDRILKDDGRLYVKNHRERLVFDRDLLGLYRFLRAAATLLEYSCSSILAQEISIRLDNQFFYSDGLDLEKELSERFEALEDVAIGGYPHLDSLMKKHFSRIYGKKKR